MAITDELETDEHRNYGEILEQVVDLQHELEEFLTTKERGKIATRIREAKKDTSALQEILNDLKSLQTGIQKFGSIPKLLQEFKEVAQLLPEVPDSQVRPEERVAVTKAINDLHASAAALTEQLKQILARLAEEP